MAGGPSGAFFACRWERDRRSSAGQSAAKPWSEALTGGGPSIPLPYCDLMEPNTARPG